MGAIRDFFFPQVTAQTPQKVSDVTAALTPVQITDSVYNILGGATNSTRQLAMSVPSVARARNIICGAVASAMATHYATKANDGVDIVIL